MFLFNRFLFMQSNNITILGLCQTNVVHGEGLFLVSIHFLWVFYSYRVQAIHIWMLINLNSQSNVLENDFFTLFRL